MPADPSHLIKIRVMSLVETQLRSLGEAGWNLTPIFLLLLLLVLVLIKAGERLNKVRALPAWGALPEGWAVSRALLHAG